MPMICTGGPDGVAAQVAPSPLRAPGVGEPGDGRVPDGVAERLGHATVLVKLATYSHAIPAMQVEGAAPIAGLVFAAE